MLFQDLYLQIISQKKYIKIAFWLSLVSVIVGAMVFYFWPDGVKYILQIFEDKFGKTKEIGWPLARAIFKNNATGMLFALLGSIFFGVIALMALGFNFFAIGLLAAFMLTSLPVALPQRILLLAAGILPHGILELPAIFLSGALGLRLGWRWLEPKNKGRRGEVLKEDVILCLKMAPIIIAVLFVAAIVEVFGTGNLLKFLANRFSAF